MQHETVNWPTNGYEQQGFRIRQEMIEGLRNYVEKGIPVGDFLYAILTNNFMHACGRADQENQRNLPAYSYFLYNHLPRECYGSQEKYQSWLEKPRPQE